jgi:uncharacterized membrane protein YhaH (DUF805 family)
MKWYLKVLNKYAIFTGRARRSEFWFFVLFNIIFSVVALILDNVIGTTISLHDNTYGDIPMPYGYIYILYVLAVFIPGLAVTVRRLHDVGKSGWMYFIILIPIIGSIWLLVLLFIDSQTGRNKWGENPKVVVV